MRRTDGSRHAISLREPSIGEPENRRFDSQPCRCRGGPTRSSQPRTEERRLSPPHRSCRSRETAADLSLRDGFRDPRRLAFTARCARRRPASRPPALRSADGRREPAGDGPLDLACTDGRRQPRPEANRARRRRFGSGVRMARSPNRLVAVVRMTPGGGRFVSTGAEGRGCHASRPRTATAGSRGPSLRCSRSGSHPSCPHHQISERH